MNSKADFYFTKNTKWQKELQQLRVITRASGLTEELKWGVPCYTLDGRNVLLLHVFKEYCAMLFFKGILLKNPEHILVRQTKNVQASRQIRFTDAQEITKHAAIIKAYVQEAIEIEAAGAKVPFKKTEEFPMPEEFQRAIDSDSRLGAAFYELTPGRQRAYLLHFAAAKQSKTRQSRIEHCAEKILKGKGLLE